MIRALMNAPARPIAFLLLTMGNAGCGDDDAERGGGTGGGASSAHSTGDGSGGGGGEAEAPRGVGRVALVSQRYVGLGQTNEVSSAQASYELLPPGFDAEAGCETREEGACTVRSCVAMDAGEIYPGELPRAVSAGLLTLRGGLREVVLDDGGSGLYPSDQSIEAELFLGGEALELDAAGSDAVPAHGTSLEAPTRVTVIEPSGGGASTLGVARTEGLRVAWTSAEQPAGSVEVQVLTRWLDAPVGEVWAVAIDCVVPQDGGSAGSVDVAATAMASLLPSGEGIDASLTVTSRASTELALDTFDVTLVATTDAVRPNGELATFALDVE